MMRGVLGEGDSELRAEDGTGSEMCGDPHSATGGQQPWSGERVQFQTLWSDHRTGQLPAGE